MAHTLTQSQIDVMKNVVSMCIANPNLLHSSELSFLKSFIESFGGEIPHKNTKTAAAEEMEDEESGQSEVELDYEGVIGEEFTLF